MSVINLSLLGCDSYEEFLAIVEECNQTNETTFLPGTRLPVELFHSEGLAVDYPLHFYLPFDYDPQKSYPVIFILDGEWHFETFANELDRSQNEAIIIGVANYDLDGYDHREKYFRLPNSSQYFDFLQYELIPYIDQRFSILPSFRVLAGHSFAGLFVIQALLMDKQVPRTFNYYVSFDGSFWAHPDVTAAFVGLSVDKDKKLKSSLLLLGATEIQGNDLSVDWLNQLFTTADFSELTIEKWRYKVDHLDIVETAITDVVQWFDFNDNCQ